MDKKEYLSELDRYLVTLPPDEKNMHLEHYGVILSELENSGKDLIEKLGTPKELATSIVFADAGRVRPDDGMNKADAKKARRRERRAGKKGIGIVWKILGGFVLFVCGISIIANIIFSGKVIYWDKANHRIVITDTENGVSYDSVLVEDFTSLDVDAGYSSVYLIPSDKYAVEYQLTGEGMVPYSVRNGKLVINDQGISALRFTFDWFDNNKSARNDYIKIYYPEGASIDNIDVNLDMGSLEMEGMTVSDLSVDLDMGGLNIKDCTIAKGDCDLDMGSLDIDNCVIGSFTVDLDMGGLDTKGLCVMDTFTADLDMGSANLNINEATPDKEPISYGYKLETEMGTVDIDGDKKGKEYKTSGDADIDVSCDMGSISISY